MSLAPFPVQRRRGADVLAAVMGKFRALMTTLVASPIYRAAVISLRTVYALVLREARTRYGRRSAGYVWALIQPMLTMFVMLVVFHRIDRAPGAGDSTVIFFITGIMPLFSFRYCITRAAGAVKGNKALMNYPQVRGFEVITARVILELLTNVLITFLIIMFTRAFTGLPISEWCKDLGELLCALGGLTVLCYGGAFLSAQIGRLFAQWTDLTRVIGRLLFFTSGLWYTLETLPPALREIVAWNPLAQVIEWVRDASIHGFESEHVNWFYPIAFGVICLFIGLFMEWLVRISGYDIDRSR